MKNQIHQDIIDGLRSEIYDTKAMQFDHDNGNYNDAQTYHFADIICTSLVNGQHKQAAEQFKRSGFDISRIIIYARDMGYQLEIHELSILLEY